MARVCFVTTVHTLHDHRFLYKECAALVAAGHEVSFIVPHEKDCVVRGVRVLALPQSKSRLRRLARSLLIVGKMLRVRADAYHICDVELLPAAMTTKIVSRKIVVYDNHEDFASYMLMKTYMPRPIGGLCKCLVHLLESFAARILDGFIAADPVVAGSYPSLPAERMHVFYNVPPLAMFAKNTIPWPERKYDVAFLGTMTAASGTYVLLEALGELKRRGRNVRARFIGQPDIKDMDERLAHLGLADNVEVTGRVNYEQVPAMLEQCRIGLIGLLDMPKFHKNIATKMFDYWAKGLAVVSADLPPERAFLEDGVHGLLVEPGNSLAFADAIATCWTRPILVSGWASPAGG